jgi:cytochrome P450
MITSYDKIMSQYAYDMCHNWRNGSIIDIHDEMMRVTLSIICKSVMSYDIESKEADKISKSLEISKNYMKRLQHPIGQVLDHIPILPKVAQSRSAIKVLDSIVYKIISERRNMMLKSNYFDTNIQNDKEEQNQDQIKKEKDLKALSQDLLTRLMYNTPSNTIRDKNNLARNESLSDVQLRDQIITFLIAGHETTANALTWTFYLLTQNPYVEKKLYEEIKIVLADKKIPSFKDISKLKYTEKVLRESMRVYPPVWTMGRFVENPYSLGEYTIPKGSTILMSQYVMHHNSKYYDDPQIYNPDRWTEEFKRNLPRFAYFPFGGGIRGCIGESFAWQEGILLLSTVMKYWKVQLVPNQKIKLDPGITLNPRKGIKIKVTSR